MASLQKRNRIVVFRLSQGEYDHLKSACAAAGGRNLSDYTRSELLAAVETDLCGSSMDRKFGEIDRKLSELQNMIQRVCERIPAPESSFAGGHNGSSSD
jgi:hypothetical protein